MTLSPDTRERLLALIRADSELRSRLDDQLEVTPDEDVALSRLIGRAFTLAETGDPLAARLVGLHRVAVAEPEIVPSRAPTITIRSAAWMVEQIKPLIASEPELAASLREQQLGHEKAGQPRADAVAEVCRELLRMSADEIGPLGGTGELARVVRSTAKRIANGSWRSEPPATDLLAESAERSLAVTSSSQQAADAVPVALPRAPGSEPKITDTRDDRSLDHDQPQPSMVITGGDAA